MKKGHDYNINDPRYVKTLGPVVSIATDNALAPAEQVIDDEFLYNTTARYLNTELTDDDKSQWLINRILRDHLRNVENGNFSGNVTVGGNLIVNGEYKKLPIATTTKAGIVRLSANSNDIIYDPTNGTPVPSTALVRSMLDRLEDLLMGPNSTTALDTIKELAEAIGDPGQALSILGRLAHLEECCAEVQELLKKKYIVTYNLTYATSENTTTEIPFINEGYETTITNTYGAAKGNAFSTLTVTMDGVDITSTAVAYTADSDEATIDIAEVTGNVVITAVSKQVCNVTARANQSSMIPSSQLITNSYKVYYGSSYTGTFTVSYNIPINYNISVDNGFICNVTSYGTQSSVIRVTKSNITTSSSYTITFTPKTTPVENYSVAKNATNATITGADEVSSGGTYTATIAPNAGYTVPTNNITVTDSSNHNVSFTYDNGTLTIQNVTSNITITVVAVEEGTTPTEYGIQHDYNTTQVDLTETGNSGNTVPADGTYSVSAVAEAGYQIDSMAVTHGGSDVTVSNNSATVSPVTGDIVVTVRSSAVATTHRLLVNNPRIEGSSYGHLPVDKDTNEDYGSDITKELNGNYAITVQSPEWVTWEGNHLEAWSFGNVGWYNDDITTETEGRYLIDGSYRTLFTGDYIRQLLMEQHPNIDWTSALGEFKIIALPSSINKTRYLRYLKPDGTWQQSPEVYVNSGTFEYPLCHAAGDGDYGTAVSGWAVPQGQTFTRPEISLVIPQQEHDGADLAGTYTTTVSQAPAICYYDISVSGGDNTAGAFVGKDATYGYVHSVTGNQTYTVTVKIFGIHNAEGYRNSISSWQQEAWIKHDVGTDWNNVSILTQNPNITIGTPTITIQNDNGGELLSKYMKEAPQYFSSPNATATDAVFSEYILGDNGTSTNATHGTYTQIVFTVTTNSATVSDDIQIKGTGAPDYVEEFVNPNYTTTQADPYKGAFKLRITSDVFVDEGDEA